MILKTLVGFLLGFILGVGGTVFMVTSGAGNYIIAANPHVQELEGKVREVIGQREFVTRRLEEVARLTERMATRFEELEDRLTELQRSRTASFHGEAADDESAQAASEPPVTPETDPASAPGT